MASQIGQRVGIHMGGPPHEARMAKRVQRECLDLRKLDRLPMLLFQRGLFNMTSRCGRRKDPFQLRLAADYDRAFEWLGQAVDHRDGGLLLKANPIYDPLRADPRYLDLLRRMRLRDAREQLVGLERLTEWKRAYIGRPRAHRETRKPCQVRSGASGSNLQPGTVGAAS